MTTAYKLPLGEFLVNEGITTTTVWKLELRDDQIPTLPKVARDYFNDWWKFVKSKIDVLTTEQLKILFANLMLYHSDKIKIWFPAFEGDPTIPVKNILEKLDTDYIEIYRVKKILK